MMIINNFLLWKNHEENPTAEAEARVYVEEDHVDEIGGSFSEISDEDKNMDKL